MAAVLYRVRDDLISFRRHETHSSTLSDFLPDSLRVKIPVDRATPVEKQVRAHISRSGWVGRFYDADSPAGSVMMGNRLWEDTAP
jgi:hypothetical protein